MEVRVLQENVVEIGMLNPGDQFVTDNGVVFLVTRNGGSNHMSVVNLGSGEVVTLPKTLLCRKLDLVAIDRVKLRWLEERVHES